MDSPRVKKPDLLRHQKFCSVCHHRNRRAIDHDFIHWCSPDDIVEEYRISSRSCLYRHAHATGLFAHRKRNIRWVLEHMLERVDEVPITASAIIRAVRAYTRITDDGEWVEPPTRVVFTHATASPGAEPARPPAADGKPPDDETLPLDAEADSGYNSPEEELESLEEGAPEFADPASAEATPSGDEEIGTNPPPASPERAPVAPTRPDYDLYWKLYLPGTRTHSPDESTG